jgi:hypothetical protein
MGLAAVLIAAGTFVLWPHEERVTKANFDRIQVGMSRATVEAMLGGPPGDYRTVRTEDEYIGPFFDARGPTPVADRPYTQTIYYDCGLRGEWFGNEGRVEVFFESGLVAKSRVAGLGNGIIPSKKFWPSTNRDLDPLDNLVWRAKRQWRKWFPG